MPAEHSGGAIQVGDWIVDPAVDAISRAGERQKLEPRTMRLLMCLVESAGSVVSQDKLLTEVWSGVVVGSASVYQAISQLRKILGDTDPQATYIATVPRKGYRLVASVGPVSAERKIPPQHPEEAPDIALPPPAIPAAAQRHPHRRTLVLAAVLIVAVIGVAWIPVGRLLFPAASAASVVVLPFIDMTAEKTDQPFCDGLTEELSNWLAQIPTLRVVARTSAFAFRGQGEDVRKIGKALDINHIVEGSLRRFGDHMRITVQLIDARNGYHLWSADYDRPLDDTIKMQEDISRSVAQILEIRLTDDTGNRFASRRTASSPAYQQYLLAKHYELLRTPESTERAIDLYRRTLLEDPKFALAYVGLSWSILNQGYFSERTPADIANDVQPLVDIALNLDPRLSDAYAVRGALRNEQSRPVEALDDLRHALTLNPNDSRAFAMTGKIMLFRGRPREALLNYRRAAALDPLDARWQIQKCTALSDLGGYAEALDACKRALTLQPGDSDAMDSLSSLASAKGDIVEALRWNAAAIMAQPANFDLYWTRADLYLTLGLGLRAHQAIEQGRKATGNGDSANAALIRVIYCESGAQALREYLVKIQLDQSEHATSLLEAAYARLMLGDASAVPGLVERSVAAPDRAPGLGEIPWYAREGDSQRLDLGAAYLKLGDVKAAQIELSSVITMLNGMVDAGVERHAVFELRAKAHAVNGDADSAMRDLQKAVDLGFRRVWSAQHEPYLASLRDRPDFRRLMDQVSRSNDRLLDQINAAAP